MTTNYPKIALIGYGSMGKEVHRIAQEKGIIISDIFDIDSLPTPSNDYDFDVAIDFSQPDAVLSNIDIMCQLKKNVVIGTTGWFNDLEQVSKLINEAGIGAVYGSNFSVGMNIFQNIVNVASLIIDKYEDYDIFLHEIHHKRKKDSPSGTALLLADKILENVKRKTSLQTETAYQAIAPEALHVSSTRGGEVAGVHSIYLDSIADTIELTHRAKNRTGLAMGALLAAKWVAGTKGVFNFSEIFNELWD